MVFFQVISSGIVAFTAGLFSFFILTSGKTDKLGRSFSINSLYVAAWAAPLVFWHLAADGGSALFLVQTSIVFSLLIPAGFFSFTIYFVESVTHVDYGKYRKAVYAIGIFFALLLVSDMLGLTSLMLPSVSHKWWFPYWPDAGPMFKYALIYFFGAFNAGFYLLFQLIRKSQDRILKGQLKAVLIGVIIAMLGGSTNYFLWYNVAIPPFGTILTTIYVISMFYAIARYQLFNIKVITAQLVTFTIWSFIFFRVLFSDTTQEFVANASLLLLVIFFGMFLIKGVLNEVKRKEQLQVITAELKNLTDHLQEKVDEQTKEIRRSYEVEKKARVELEDLSTAKDQFILAAQNSLISPLKSIEKRVKELKDLSLPGEAVEDVLKIADSTERLNDLVDEFVSISQIRIGKDTLKTERINLPSIVRGIFDELTPQITKANLQTSLTFPPLEKDNVLDIDKEKLKEALTNLIDNAVKYNQPGGSITVKGERTRHPIERDKEIYRLTIENTGLGLTPEELSQLFTQYFQRGKEAEKLYTTGRGIGLAVTKNIIQAHQGKIYAESGGRGQGARFVVELPV